MAAFVKYNSGVEALVEGIDAGAAGTWKVALTNTAPNAATHTVLGDITDLATSGGYTAGGNVVAVSSSTQTSGTYKLVLTPPAQWVATGGGFTFRYAVLYNTVGNALVGYWDYASSIVMNGTNGDTFDLVLSGANGVFQGSFT